METCIDMYHIYIVKSIMVVVILEEKKRELVIS
jgi:hypothetical protein